jgi:hypothetical protein
MVAGVEAAMATVPSMVGQHGPVALFLRAAVAGRRVEAAGVWGGGRRRAAS